MIQLLIQLAIAALTAYAAHENAHTAELENPPAVERHAGSNQ